MNSNEYNMCLDGLDKIINLINSISNENIINELQYINNNLSSLIQNYGIYNFENFIKICLSNEFGEKYLKGVNLNNKLDVICKYLHPINYKILNWTDKSTRSGKKIITKEISKNKIIDDKSMIEETEQLECFDLMRSSTNFNLRVYGVKAVSYTHLTLPTKA